MSIFIESKLTFANSNYSYLSNKKCSLVTIIKRHNNGNYREDKKTIINN